MPETRVVFYKDDNGKSPVYDWLQELKHENAAAFKICSAAIQDLAEYGYELRRPRADALRDGIKELRAKHQRVQYRILYFFNGWEYAVLAHAIEKKSAAVPDEDIKRALARKVKFETNPARHTRRDNDNA